MASMQALCLALIALSVMVAHATPRFLQAGAEHLEQNSTAVSPKPVSVCQIGDRVEAWYARDTTYHPAVVTSVNSDGTVTVRWDDFSPWFRIIDAAKVRKNGVMCTDSVLPLHGEQLMSSRGVVYFLFLVTEGLPHSKTWRRFFETAPRDDFRALVHCKDIAACRRNGVEDLPGVILVPTTPTWYCHDLVTAMAQLLESALKLHAAPLNDIEKFVFISDSTLPVKNFRSVHAALTKDIDSDFCIFPRDQWGEAVVNGNHALLVKHHQWMVLSRPHAELFVEKWVPVNATGGWRVWLKDGLPSHTWVSPKVFARPQMSNWCTDEWAFLATIYGALLPLSGTRTLEGFGGGPLHFTGKRALISQGRCRTFTFWEREDGPTFAAVADHIHEDKDSYMTCYPKCYVRPASFQKLGKTGLRALRESEFLFARKMSETVRMPEYNQTIIDAL